MDKNAKSIIFVGAGRSGSSLLHRVCSYQDDFCWLTPMAHRFPERYWLNDWAITYRNLAFSMGLESQARVFPREAYGFWDHLAPGFRRPFRDLGKTDLSQGTKRSAAKKIDAFLKTHRANNLLLKITGWPRIAYLEELFSTPFFFNVVRDPRSVVSSYLKIGNNWRGWEGPWNWRFGLLDEKYQAIWDDHDRSFAALAAIQWCLIDDAIEKASLSSDITTIRYEDFCNDPIKVLEGMFCALMLKPSKRVHQFLQQQHIENRQSWHRDLNSTQVKAIEQITEAKRKKYSYFE